MLSADQRAQQRLFVRLVFPEDLEPSNALPSGATGDVVAGDGENGLNPRVGGKESIQRHADATVQLFRGGPRRHREVESIHESCSPQRNEAQDGRFRLAGSGFTFQDQERLIQWRLSHRDLSRPRLLVGEQRSNIIGSGRVRRESALRNPLLLTVAVASRRARPI